MMAILVTVAMPGTQQEPQSLRKASRSKKSTNETCPCTKQKTNKKSACTQPKTRSVSMPTYRSRLQQQRHTHGHAGSQANSQTRTHRFLERMVPHAWVVDHPPPPNLRLGSAGTAPFSSELGTTHTTTSHGPAGRQGKGGTAQHVPAAGR